LVIPFEFKIREWEDYNHPFCLKPAHPEKEVGYLSEDYLKITQMILYEWLLLDLPDI
jgi:hypothetical protein